MLLQFGINCSHIRNKTFEQSVPYFALNRYILEFLIRICRTYPVQKIVVFSICAVNWDRFDPLRLVDNVTGSVIADRGITVMRLMFQARAIPYPRPRGHWGAYG